MLCECVFYLVIIKYFYLVLFAIDILMASVGRL